MREVTDIELAKSLQLLVDRVGWVEWNELHLFEGPCSEAMHLLADAGLAEYALAPLRWSLTRQGMFAYEAAQIEAGRALRKFL